MKFNRGVEPDFRPTRKAHGAFLCADLDELCVEIAAQGLDLGPLGYEYSGFVRCDVFDPFDIRVELM